MYPNPPFNDVDGQRSADDSQSFAQVRIVQPRDWWLIALWVAIFASVAAGASAGVHAAWPDRHTSLGADTAATYLRMALLLTVMATVLIALTRLVVGRLNRLCAKVKSVAAQQDKSTKAVESVAEALRDLPRHDEQVAVLQEVAAATVAAGQQLQSRSDQIVRGLDRIQKDRVAQGLARDGWDAALLDGVREVINKALTDLAASVNSAQQDADARLAAMERALCEVSGHLTRRVDTIEVTTRSGAAIYAKVIDEIRAAVGPIVKRLREAEDNALEERLMVGKALLAALEDLATVKRWMTEMEIEIDRVITVPAHSGREGTAEGMSGANGNGGAAGHEDGGASVVEEAFRAFLAGVDEGRRTRDEDDPPVA